MKTRPFAIYFGVSASYRNNQDNEAELSLLCPFNNWNLTCFRLSAMNTKYTQQNPNWVTIKKKPIRYLERTIRNAFWTWNHYFCNNSTCVAPWPKSPPKFCGFCVSACPVASPSSLWMRKEGERANKQGEDKGGQVEWTSNSPLPQCGIQQAPILFIENRSSVEGGGLCAKCQDGESKRYGVGSTSSVHALVQTWHLESWLLINPSPSSSSGEVGGCHWHNPLPTHFQQARSGRMETAAVRWGGASKSPTLPIYTIIGSWAGGPHLYEILYSSHALEALQLVILHVSSSHARETWKQAGLWFLKSKEESKRGMLKSLGGFFTLKVMAKLTYQCFQRSRSFPTID